MYIFKYSSIAFLLFGFLFASCKKDLKLPPIIPSPETFVSTIDDFDSKNFTDTTMVNWWQAKNIVSNWNLKMFENLSVPIASFIEASKNKEPVYLSDNTWLWDFNFNCEDINYSSKLFGTEKTDSVVWEMYITKSGEYVDFLWFSGISLNKNNTVIWTINDNPDNACEFLSLNYDRQSSEIVDIKITNISPSDAENGSYISVGQNDDNSFNRYFISFTKTNDKKIEIIWNSEAKNGKIFSYELYQDSIWHCWDATLKDVYCN